MSNIGPFKQDRKDWLRIPDVPKYVWAKVGVKISRDTAYRWVKSGRVNYSGQRIRLQTQKRLFLNLTTEEWVDEFIKEFQEEES